MASTDPQTEGKDQDSSALDRTVVPGDALGKTQDMPAQQEQPQKSTQAGAASTSTAGGKKSGQAARGQKKVSQLGDFKLVKKLGQGGMGTVYLARQVSLDRKVALKTLSKELAKNEDAVKRFLREARSMAKLAHPNIVQVYAADSHAGYNYAALEFIDGQSMQDVMDQRGKISIGDALHVILVCADALRHAHEQNMVHRDVKPDNILVTKAGVVKVSDFGLAKAVDEDLSVTKSGTGLGTPLYMSPEQARNAKYVDRSSDIYSLGITLYYFVTGQLPFTGESTLEVITNKEQGKFTPARRLNPDIPERLDLIIDKMVAKDQKHRYSDCGKVIADLEKVGLASPVLSFAEVTAGSSPLSKLGTSTATAMSATREMPPPAQTMESLPDEKYWIVNYEGNDGKPHTKKMSEQEVVRWIKGGLLDLQAKAKRNQGDQLLPLAQYQEFVQYVEQAALRARTKKQSAGSRMKQMYADVDKYERRKKWRRFFGRITSSTLGGIGLVIWLGVIAGVCVALYFLIPWLGGYIADYFNLR